MNQNKPLREYLNEENMAKRYLAGLALLKEEHPKLPAKSIHHRPENKRPGTEHIEPSYPLINKYSLNAFWEFMAVPVIASGFLFTIAPFWAVVLGSISLLALLFSSALTYTGRSKQKFRKFLAKTLLSKTAWATIEEYKREHVQYFKDVANYKKLVCEVREEIQPFLNHMNDGDTGFTYINDMGKVVRLDPSAKSKYATILGEPVSYQ